LTDLLYEETFSTEDTSAEWIRPDFARLSYAREKIASFGEFLCDNAERVLDNECTLTFELTSDFCDSEYDSFSEWMLKRRAI